ncbi:MULTISPECIES: (2Fe-2S)-binding protein [unclassified Porphyromonas]|uniref:(2Fe-2S)-binding protein n=1 Tax=unclassified Porphyromonas TaxID=2645799 RepID=UPI00052BBA00|nr:MULTISPECIES: (2Fe-2S)-binding protein [unclassified Porphyromonas]KGN86771.1 nitrite reductase [Porphyromonas sp. COT-290 OH860]KGO01337.1 nitrite reductase [Porphyromonas sp. COT-290 OH3588]
MGQADEIICHCLGITRGQIEEAVREKGLSTFDEVSEATEAGSVCGSCQDDIEEIIAEIKG